MLDAILVVVGFVIVSALVLAFFVSVATGSFERMVIRFYDFVTKEGK